LSRHKTTLLAVSLTNAISVILELDPARLEAVALTRHDGQEVF
jgi:hypothetical protein